MECTENPLKNSLNQCNFMQNLLERVSGIHNEVVEHENLVPKCETCWRNTDEFGFIKNQLFLIVRINFHLKDERNPIEDEEKLGTDVLELGSYDIVKHETEDLIESTTFVAVENFPDTSEDKIDFQTIVKQQDYKRLKATKKLYKCELCRVKVSKKCHLVLHMRKHMRNWETPRTKKHSRFNGAKDSSTKKEEDTRQKCPFCQRIYKTRHECRLTEHKVAIFSCAHCSETFSTYPKIYLHHKTYHPDKPRPLSPFQCDVCGTFALRLSALKRHMRTHTGYTPFICDVCQKGFQTRPQLVEHQRKHIPKSERDDKYKCDICQKKFTFRQSLKKHKLLQHTDNRKIFPCNICGGKFISETSLQKHLTSHVGKAPRAHKCEECGRIFEKLKYFNQHRKIQHKIFTDLMLNAKPKKKD